MTRTILHLGAGALMGESIRLLRGAGYRVHAIDGNPEAPGLALADRGEAIDFGGAAAVERYARRHRVDLILGVNEPGVWSAAIASARLGLPNVPPDVAWRCLHKGRMRLAWERAGLRQPAFRIASTHAEARTAAAELGFPVVLKPTFGWGSRGVSVIESAGDVDEALAFADAHRRPVEPRTLALLDEPAPEDAAPYVVERFVAGRELTVEGLVDDGRVEVLAISDKSHQPHPRYRVAMALRYPAALAPAARRAVERTVEDAVAALGLERGAFHCECFVGGTGDDARVDLVELGARGGGGHIFGLIVELASGVRMPVALARLFLGEPADVRARFSRGVCYRFFMPPPGTFRAVRGLERARELPGVAAMGFDLAPGSRVGAISDDTARAGFIVATGRDREEAIARADAALAAVDFEMEPSGVGPGDPIEIETGGKVETRRREEAGRGRA